MNGNLWPPTKPGPMLRKTPLSFLPIIEALGASDLKNTARQKMIKAKTPWHILGRQINGTRNKKGIIAII